MYHKNGKKPTNRKLRYIKDNDEYIINNRLRNLLDKIDICTSKNYLTFTEFHNILGNYIKINNIYIKNNDSKSKYIKLLYLFEDEYNYELKNNINSIINKGGSGYPYKITKEILGITHKKRKTGYENDDSDLLY